ncbi:MAG: hypothetical protein P0Y53_01150 [Candidatus Pseudobacter hemicellulosilyticus]|uniref:Uncharacterized protein n=1 Tax=Candidatus Pseudobacter hemicellulosilyticus TaxID=3121375 RepID=A0AAJ6BHN9_9BACT|nr:MAG: hypothetical protein P0Y53_01150 [Pseudobacter sp.]
MEAQSTRLHVVSADVLKDRQAIQLGVLQGFYVKMMDDPRIGKSHLAVFLSIFLLWLEKGEGDELACYSVELRRISKISGTATFHAVIRDLHSLGFIHYHPSYYKGRPSRLKMTVSSE